VTHSLYCSSQRQKLSTSYRARAADFVFDQGGTVGSADGKRTGGFGDGWEMDGDAEDALTESIERLLASTNLGIDVKYEKLRQYSSNQLSRLSQLFGNNMSIGTRREDGSGGCAGEAILRPRQGKNVHSVVAFLNTEVVEENGVAATASVSNVTAYAGRGVGDDVSVGTVDVEALIAKECLNPVQEKGVRKVVEYVQQLKAWKGDSTLPEPSPMNLLVHGGPGTGKTHWIEALDRILTGIGSGIGCCAFTGIAASKLPRPRTVHMMLAFGRKKGRRKQKKDDVPESGYNVRLPDLDASSRALAAKRLENKDIFLVDEVSMIGPVMLGLIDQRLKEITGNTGKKFGGMGVILTGDFFQLPPVVPRMSLYKSVVAKYEHGVPAYNSGTPGDNGTELFHGFDVLSFTQQQRCADDAQHCADVEAVRDPTRLRPITPGLISRLQPLTVRDVLNDPGWMFAPIIVTSNYERMAINRAQVLRFAKVHGLPVIRWRLQIAGAGRKYKDNGTLEGLYGENDDLWGYFVQGAPGFVTENVGRSYGVVNGTRGTLHSLTFSADADEEEVAIVRSKILAAGAGQVVDLPFAPVSVNVSIDDKRTATWPTQGTLVDGAVVVPITLCSDTSEVTLTGRYHGTINVYRHSVDLGFSVTFHKVQGQTLDKVILDVNKRPFRPYVDLPGFYVAISRVKSSCNMRILPRNSNDGPDLSYLTNLRHDRFVCCKQPTIGANSHLLSYNAVIYCCGWRNTWRSPRIGLQSDEDEHDDCCVARYGRVSTCCEERRGESVKNTYIAGRHGILGIRGTPTGKLTSVDTCTVDNHDFPTTPECEHSTLSLSTG
jgi:hypothetical protein